MPQVIEDGHRVCVPIIERRCDRTSIGRQSVAEAPSFWNADKTFRFSAIKNIKTS